MLIDTEKNQQNQSPFHKKKSSQKTRNIRKLPDS